MFFIISFVLFFSIFQSSLSNEINLYTTRHYEADYEIYRKFQNITGIKVNVVSGKSKPLEKRIIEEGKNCKGDLFFLADAGRLYSAEKKNLFQKIKSSLLFDDRKIQNIIKESNAIIVTVNPEFFVIEKSGRTYELDELYEKLSKYGILQYVRSARIAVTKAPLFISDILKKFKKK